MTATNMCSNFGSKWYSPPLIHKFYKNMFIEYVMTVELPQFTPPHKPGSFVALLSGFSYLQEAP